MAVEIVALKLAESVVSQAIERITDLIDEAYSLRAVSADIQSLQTELKWIESFLRDADKKQEKDEQVRMWVSEVRDVACEIEDSVETYVYKVRSSYTKTGHLRKLRDQIKLIKDKLRGISERRQRYQIEIPNGDRELNSLQTRRRSFPDEEDDDIITLKSTMAALKDQLLRNEDRSFVVVSIVGMGGLGKTTLAKKAYNDVDVKKQFNCNAWVFVSQQCLAREVLTEILMQVGFRSSNKTKKSLKKVRYTKALVEERKGNREILKGLEDHELVSLMRSELHTKRYLIVLDDIWSLDAWNSIRSAFPTGKQGSRVVFTTRIKEVALSADPYSTPIEPPFLTSQESWELLQRKAFPREIFGENGCPPEFEGIGKDMVAECGGLPLAIVVLGGLLRTKNSLVGWEKVKKDVKSRMINKLKSEKQYRVEDILELSFQELPYYLKPCFLYLGSFPEDSEIRKRKLIRLWNAERFVRTTEKEESNGVLIEYIGEQYLEELIDRCMVQVDKFDHTGKGVKSCRLHDLMRDFCLSKSKEELFLETKDQHEVKILMGGSSLVHYPLSRRIAVHGSNGLESQSSSRLVEQVHPHLRTLLCFSIQKLSSDYRVMKNFRLLRVLKLDFLDRAKLPNAIGNMIHLRYLRVSGRGHTFDVPGSIGNLRNLQTLDFFGIQVYYGTMLPSTLWKLTQLRHLLLPLTYSLPFWAINGFFKEHAQVKLETIKGIEAKDLIKNKSVLSMRNIKVLGISKLRSTKEVTLVLNSLSSNSQLGRLRSLRMSLSLGRPLEGPMHSFPKMELLSQCQELTKLDLYGPLPNENLSYLPKSLTKLILWRSRMNQEKITILEKLSSLRVLQFGYEELKVYQRCQTWVFAVDGFLNLENLSLLHIGNVEEWKVEEGSMPNLKRLDITGMSKLKAIPEGLKHVTTLSELNIRRMRKEFEDRLRGVNGDGAEGKDFHQVSHIPSITFADTYA